MAALGVRSQSGSGSLKHSPLALVSSMFSRRQKLVEGGARRPGSNVWSGKRGQSSCRIWKSHHILHEQMSEPHFRCMKIQ